MKNIKKAVFRVSIPVLLLQLGFGVVSMPVYAVSPGWDSSSSESSQSSSTSSSQSNNSSSESSSSITSSSSSQSSHEPSSSSVSSDSRSSSSRVTSASNASSDNSVRSSSSQSSESPVSSSSSSSSSDSSSESSISSSSSSIPESVTSSSTVANSTKTYSIDDLLQDAYAQYKLRRDNLVSENKQSMTDNNNKGANELYAAYQAALKNIKSGKTTLQEREQSVSTQKSALQEALSARLNSLQDTYNQQVQVVQDKINVLPGDHAHDNEAVKLQDQLTSLDYNLSHDSNLAYTRYNKAVAKLNKQAEHASVKSKKDQRADAKTTYLENLQAVHAQDPKSLNRENSKKLSDLKSKYKDVKKMIKNKDISTPVDIEKYF